MCGRYTLATPADLIGDLLEIDSPGPLEPRYNIAPSQEAPIVRAAGGRREMAPAVWGLVPRWAREPSIGNRLINARSETAHRKPAFEESFRRRRCLVVADGFYEWKRTAGAKQPYLFRPATAPIFTFAGLWDRWRDGPLTIESFTILTTDANASVAPVHDRMPVILGPAERASWLASGAAPGLLRPLLRPPPPTAVEGFPVSTLVNSPDNDSPACVEPLLGDESPRQPTLW